MRADIDNKGRLLLQPESQTEEAALFAWWEDGIDSEFIPRLRLCAMAYDQRRGGITATKAQSGASDRMATIDEEIERFVVRMVHIHMDEFLRRHQR